MQNTYPTKGEILEQIDAKMERYQECAFMMLEAKNKGTKTIYIDQYEWLLDNSIQMMQNLREYLSKELE